MVTLTTDGDIDAGEIALVREALARLEAVEALLNAAAASTEIASAAASVHDMRAPLAAALWRWEAIASARRSGRVEGRAEGWASGYAAGLGASPARGARVVPLRGRRPVSA